MSRARTRTTLAAAAAALTCTAGVFAATAADAAGTATGPSIVPPPGAPTAYGYTALIRHGSSAGDGTGRLVLRAPDGRSSSIGAVPDWARVEDVSTNARTVVTADDHQGSTLLSLTVWDTESRKPTRLDVADGMQSRLVKGGIVVSRFGKPAQLYSRSGTLLRTYSGTTGWRLSASADGTRIMQDDSAGRIIVRDAVTGAILRTVPVPTGMAGCQPSYHFDSSSFTMDCYKRVDVAPQTVSAYRTGYTAAVATTRLMSFDGGSNVRKVDGGMLIFDKGAESPCREPYVLDIAGVGLPLKFGDYSWATAGAYGRVVDLGSFSGCGDVTGALVRRDIASGAETRIAGRGTAIGGFVTSAKTVDGT
ncbi:hypothetical protein PZ938_19270 [Luteipulveratus sp. YIM 133132]|uniref:hypothetical protein n=1 Tax=Luteipulveratus flavus TaxID=3031728 RepID=UPI0023B09075|nr:hypothetical protein [Luteipulveratus sp. YIM 133132]MDE9367764.1 hypothetical protein [Luteipulveratus sp. YIM 133132]